MSRFVFVFCLCLCVAVGAFLISGVAIEVASGQSPSCGQPSANGDLNADATVDISDAVYLLEHLFNGGPAPCPLDCSFPSTGQTVCYDDTNCPAPCDVVEPFLPLQDGCVQSGCPPQGRFVVEDPNNTGELVIRDQCTGLMWMAVTADTNGDGQINGDDDKPWDVALNWCANSDYAGFEDWRLPNTFELISIQNLGDPDRRYPEFVFEDGVNWYWTSTNWTNGQSPCSGHAWMVGFIEDYPQPYSRLALSDAKSTPRYIRAVRGGTGQTCD